MTNRIKIVYVFLFALLYSCNQTNPSLNNKVREEGDLIIECGAEDVKDNSFLDNTGQYLFSGAQGRSNEMARHGNASVKLVKSNPYGMSLTLEGIKPDDFFYITAWKKGNGHLCATNDDPEGFFMATNSPVETDSLGWQKVSLKFYIPYNYKKDFLKVLFANFGTDTVYFDDLSIFKTSNRTFPTFEGNDAMNIFIDKASFSKLKEKRDSALKGGILFTEDDDWVKAIIFYKDQVLDTRLRLKGDRLDHLEGKKWSFRIKVKGEDSWKGMKTFSIQTPEARFMLHEWFFHQALDQEDILCTRYGFVPVTINGESMGIYAWEEHFQKQLIEARQRREGPILKLTDDAYWLYDRLTAKQSVDFNIPSYDASVIEPFNEKNILSDSLLFKEFKRGHDLYYQYKYAKGLASDIFNVDAAAKYYAMTDATNAYHTLHFFNQRFYYNPVLGKLEPIFFDSFPYNGIFNFNGKDIIPQGYADSWNNIHLKLFADPAFKERYFYYLEKYSSRDFWEKLYQDNKKETDSLNVLLEKEFPDYHFEMQTYYQVALEARVAMEKLKKEGAGNDLFAKFSGRDQGVIKNYKGKAEFEMLPYLIKVFKQSDNLYRVINLSTDSIKLMGFSNSLFTLTDDLNQPFILPPANSGNMYKTDVKSNFPDNSYLFVEVRDSLIPVSVYPWEAPVDIAPFQNVLHSFNINDIEVEGIKTKDDTILFSGNIRLAKNLIIPENRIVYFTKGTNVDLVNGATFLSYSPVLIKGTESEPVIFSSSDHNGKGFNVFQAKGQSTVENASFTGLTNMDFDGWVTTASVCFYESNVIFKNVDFGNNINCDDALNVVRSVFFMEGCHFQNTFADAFDSDFSRGKVISTKFSSPGNDGLDFSGSRITLSDCTINNASDKGISCGEESSVVVKNCLVDGGNIGVASKDKSKVIIENSTIKNVAYGLVAFCKKPEYGPADIVASNLIVKDYIILHLIEEGSNLNFNNREIFGHQRNVAKRFY